MDLSKLRVVGRCGDCRHWDSVRCRRMDTWPPDSIGVKTDLHSKALAITVRGSTNWCGVQTDRDFGCVMFEFEQDHAAIDSVMERIERLEGTHYAEDD